MQEDRNMGDYGDSGAVTYIIDRNTIYGKAVGVLKGASGDGRTVLLRQVIFNLISVQSHIKIN